MHRYKRACSGIGDSMIKISNIFRCKQKVCVDVVGILQNALDIAKKMYSLDFQKEYYLMLYNIQEDKTDIRSQKLLEASLYMTLHSENKPEFCSLYTEKYEIHYVSKAIAANIIYKQYKPKFNRLKIEAYSAKMSKQQRQLVEEFFETLLKPTESELIWIKEGQTQCQYDIEHRRDYCSTLRVEVNSIIDKCLNIIDTLSCYNNTSIMRAN